MPLRAGLGGLTLDLAFVMRYLDGDPRNEGGADGLAGQYIVTFVLHRPMLSPVDEYTSQLAEEVNGDSHIVIADPAAAALSVPSMSEVVLHASSGADDFVFRGVPNARGRLHRIKSDPFQAANFTDAESRTQLALASILSAWSARLDVPLRVFQMESLELRTRSVRRNFVCPFLDVPLVAPVIPISDDFRACAAMYREALNSNSALYQFLCLYKVLEGIRNLRSRVKKPNDVRPDERIPKDTIAFIPWLNTIFPGWTGWDAMAIKSIFRTEVLGKKAATVIQDYLRPIRDEVAHFFTHSGDKMSLDANVLQTKVHQWLHLTRCLARLLMKNQFPEEMLLPGKLGNLTEGGGEPSI